MDAPVPLHSPPCVICGSERFDTVLRGVRDWIWQKPGVFQLQQCADCDLVATRPRPTPEGLGFYYDQAYSGEAQVVDSKDFYETGLGRAISAYRLITLGKVRQLGADDRLLDVGCNHGSFLRFARDKTGCSASGIDLDQGSIEGAVDPEHIDYRAGRLPEADYPDGAFTVVTFLECLEHETDPVGGLRAAHRVLAPGGICLVEVPNWGGLWRKLFGSAWMPLLVPQHLSHFTPATLGRAFEAAGFELVHQQGMVYPLELTASLGIAVGRVFGPKPPSPGVLRRAFDAVVGLVLAVVWLLLDVPTQVLLRLFQANGHMTVIARKPEPLSPA